MTIDDDSVLWAWTGDLENRFDLDRESEASLEFAAKKQATRLLVTDNLHPEARKAPFGKWVTLTFQAVDDDDEPVAEEDVEVRIRIIEKNDRRTVRDRTTTHETDSSGEFELRFRQNDPDSRDDDHDATLDLNILRTDLEIKDETAVRVAEGTLLQWSDDEEDPTVLLLEQTARYHFPSDSGRGRSNSVTATLLDQYGDPVRGERVHFTSDDPMGLAWYRVGESDENESLAKSAYRKTTSRRGMASVTYYRDSDLPGVETIEAFIDGVIAKTLDHFWIAETPYGETVDNVKVPALRRRGQHAGGRLPWIRRSVQRLVRGPRCRRGRCVRAQLRQQRSVQRRDQRGNYRRNVRRLQGRNRRTGHPDRDRPLLRSRWREHLHPASTGVKTTVRGPWFTDHEYVLIGA